MGIDCEEPIWGQQAEVSSLLAFEEEGSMSRATTLPGVCWEGETDGAGMPGMGRGICEEDSKGKGWQATKEVKTRVDIYSSRVVMVGARLEVLLYLELYSGNIS